MVSKILNNRVFLTVLTLGYRYGDLVRQLTAGVIVTYMACLTSFLVMSPGINYYSWRYFLEVKLMSSFSTLFVVSLCWQSWLGIQGVVESYLRDPRLRLVLLSLVGFIIFLYFCLGVSIIWDIG